VRPNVTHVNNQPRFARNRTESRYSGGGSRSSEPIRRASGRFVESPLAALGDWCTTSDAATHGQRGRMALDHDIDDELDWPPVRNGAMDMPKRVVSCEVRDDRRVSGSLP
jgi:hypothetical protein